MDEDVVLLNSYGNLKGRQPAKTSMTTFVTPRIRLLPIWQKQATVGWWGSIISSRERVYFQWKIMPDLMAHHMWACLSTILSR